MSEILKAKNRIINRTKVIPHQELNQENQDPSPHKPLNILNQLNEQTFDNQPVTNNYNKKFNISSISLKFTKNQEDQHSVSYTPRRQDMVKLNVPQQESYFNPRNEQKPREKSPEFSRTERINPIRHFEPYNLNTLSESNSHSSLYKWSKNKSRRTQNYPHDDEFQKKSDVRTTMENKFLNESPINKIKKTVHPENVSLLIAKQDNRRAQSPYKPRQCIKQFTEMLVKETRENQKPYVDLDFPPKPTIFFPKKSLYEEQAELSFERLPKIYQKLQIEVVIMKSSEPTLINPGRYTNPYLYSAIRILAQYPQKVLSLIENQKINDQGIYYIKLCKDGTWRYIVVDDYVPIKIDPYNPKNSEIFGFSSIQVNGVVQIWPSLIEKAIAKVYSTYYDLSLSRRDGICPLLRALTGFPVSKYDLIKDVRSYLVLIDSALKRQHIVILEQILPEFEYLAELKGLSIEESYQILEIQKNFFVLRNLADFDLVTKLTFDEVMMFSSLLLFRKEENYNYISQKLRHRKGYFSSLKVQVPITTQCYWDVWQNNPAYYKNHLENKISYEVAPFKIVIQPLSVESLPSYDSVPEPETIVESGKQITMKKGEYLVSIHLCQSMKEMDFTLSYYGQKDVQIERVKNIKQRWHENCCGGDIQQIKG